MSESKDALSSAEAEFVAEMRLENPPPEPPPERWSNFDPDFKQADIDRLIKRGWFEKRGTGRHREYRWTPAGRVALAEFCRSYAGKFLTTQEP